MTWIYEVLETLPIGCPDEMRYAAEQRHINRLRSWDPAHGFNVEPADYSVEGPAREFARRYRAAIAAATLEKLRSYQTRT